MLLARQPHCSCAAAPGSRNSSNRCLHAAASSPWCSRASSLQLHGNPAAAVAITRRSVSSNGRAAGLVCRDAPRPMWARKSPPPEPSGGDGKALAKLITKQISSAETVVQLADVFNEWGGSFDYIHAAAALTKFAKLSRRGQRDSRLLQLLVRKWLQMLPEAGARECANILWACANLSKQREQVDTVWGPTWAAFMQHVERQSGEGLVAQNVANAVYAAAQLRKQPAAAELQVLVQAFLQPEVLADAAPQASANLVWAIGQLSQSHGWKGGVSEQNVRQLLGEQQLCVLAGGKPQEISNVLVALARMVAGNPPLVGRTFAQQCSMQLLSLASAPLSTWPAQEVTNTMWATAALGLPDAFVAKAVQAARSWILNSVSKDLTQAAQACAMLQYSDEAFLSLLLQRASVLLQQQQQQQQGKPRGSSRVLSAADKASLAGILAASVANLDMQQLAAPARDLIASSRVGQQANIHVSVPRRLWAFHAWLLQHQLLDGRGLTGLVTQQQLQQGQKDAGVYGSGVAGVGQRLVGGLVVSCWHSMYAYNLCGSM